jgi:hypothetical protein
MVFEDAAFCVPPSLQYVKKLSRAMPTTIKVVFIPLAARLMPTSFMIQCQTSPIASVDVDCPGLDILMASMLNGAAIREASLLLLTGNETCPPSERMAAVGNIPFQHVLTSETRYISSSRMLPWRTMTKFEHLWPVPWPIRHPFCPLSAVFSKTMY